MKRVRFEIGIVVIQTVDTTLGNLRRALRDIQAALGSVKPGTVVVVTLD